MKSAAQHCLDASRIHPPEERGIFVLLMPTVWMYNLWIGMHRLDLVTRCLLAKKQVSES
jgi:hypothetical protein